MKFLLQRVTEASVCVADREVARIAKGLLIFIGIKDGDTDAQIKWLVQKAINMRIFNDQDGRMNISLEDIGGSVLLVSQFTLYGDCMKGNRPSYIQAAAPIVAKPIYENVIREFTNNLGSDRVQKGVFGADMKVNLVNDGPVTILIEK